MSSSGYDLEPVLRTVARTTAACLGFGTAVINLYRPAWDDFRTVVVEGSEDARHLLLGQTSTADDWAPLLDQRVERHSIDEMLEGICTGVSDALGFHKVVVGLEDENGMIVPRAHRGVPDEELGNLRNIPLAAIAPILDPSLERDGVVFIEQEAAEERIDPALHDASQSRRNGRGDRAWRNHVLLVPLSDREGRLVGALWAEDPDDRLLPTDEILRAIRAFANHAMSAVESARQLELIRHLAEHDPPTGLPNRRG